MDLRQVLPYRHNVSKANWDTLGQLWKKVNSAGWMETFAWRHGKSAKPAAIKEEDRNPVYDWPRLIMAAGETLGV